jgi:alcohol dehydrogenase (NADP+)
VTEDLLTDEEMKIMATLDRNCRFIKGHVFLWEGVEDWYDLWDINGTITKLK